MTEQITITVNGKNKEILKSSKLLEVIKNINPEPVYPVLGAMVNNLICDLWYEPKEGDRVVFIDRSHPDGSRMLIRGLTMILVKAARDLFPKKRIKILHSLSQGLYCRWSNGTPMNKKEIKKIKKRMEEIIRQDYPFVRKQISKKESIKIFKKEGLTDKVNLLPFRKRETLKVYTLDGYTDYFFGRLPASTGFIEKFELKYFAPGLIMRFPNAVHPEGIPPYHPQHQLARIYSEYKHWAEIMEVSDVASLNEIIMKGEINELIRVAEALHEKKIAQIADLITKDKEDIRVILIAGPSSSGKTTFAQRLRVQLIVNGLKPIALSLDDYFLDKENTPLDEFGNYDFDHIEAIDISLFNEHLQSLMMGEEVSIPRFDFIEGKRIVNHKKLKITDKNVLIIEGIHGLNERLTESIPQENKYKIYVSALTMLNLDNHNRIPTTDTRIIRRIVRDSRFRNHTATETIHQWPMVRRGEERFIFPFQEEADVMFNSALLYELAALKGFVTPLLKSISPQDSAYAQAKRLLSFTDNFIEIGTDEIPPNSILREFIGATCFFKMDVPD